jgi:hypothetical protein
MHRRAAPWFDEIGIESRERRDALLRRGMAALSQTNGADLAMLRDWLRDHTSDDDG